jgi:Na+/H+ antiporter NhaD/arsenite permease-like protein
MNLHHVLLCPGVVTKKDRISAHRDPVRVVIWVAALVLVAAAGLFRAHLLIRAVGITGAPFLTLAAVIAAGLALDRAGVFRVLARLIVPASAPDWLATAGALGLTALLSGLVNLDVAVVVALPVALSVARHRGLHPGRLAVAAALTANATSFLFPTSNLTTLLVLDRAPVAAWTFVAQSWVAWLLVTVVTVGALSLMVKRPGSGMPPAGRVTARTVTLGVAAMALIDLVPMFFGASAINALLDGGMALHGGLLGDLAMTSVLAAGANNLPAAAALVVGAGISRWAAVLGLAIGPNLLLTGSVATLISRRIARDHGAEFSALTFSVVGAALLPLQLLLALAGLHLTGAI